MTVVAAAITGGPVTYTYGLGDGAFVLMLIVLAILLSLCVGFISGFTVIRHWRGSNEESVRRAHVAELAGFTYRWKVKFTNDPSWRGGVFGKGAERRARDVIYGQYKGRPVAVFEYQWVQKVDRQDQVFSRMVGAAWVGGNLPFIACEEEGPVSNLPGDILVESMAFNDRFRLTSPNRDTAIHVMDARMLEYLVSLGHRAPAFWIENGWVFTHAPVVKGEGAGEQLQKLVSYPAGIASRIPPFVLKDNGGGVIDPGTRDPELAVKQFMPFVDTALPFPRREPFSKILGEVTGRMFSSAARNTGDVLDATPWF